MTLSHLQSGNDNLPFWQRHPDLLHATIFFGIWLFVFATPWMGMFIVIASSDPLGWMIVRNSWMGLLPYFAISFINEFVLVPAFFSKRRYFWYVAGLVLVLTAFYILQNRAYINFIELKIANSEYIVYPDGYIATGGKDYLHVNLPVLKRLAMAIMIVGLGLGYNVMQNYRKKFRRMKELERYRLQQELLKLRAQMSPHFLMNMLNNIHSTMDHNVDMAQNMLLKLSRLLHYVTYDTSKELVRLEDEIKFIKSFIELMSARYPAERIDIDATFPDKSDACVCVPPMLFINFIENAFKHGITYRRHTSIKIRMELTPKGRLHFQCVNTVPPKTDVGDRMKDDKLKHQGVGLASVKRHLEMLYGNDFSLNIRYNREKDLFEVELDMPTHEDKMCCD